MRIAILGGTFDPIHNGHLVAAKSVASTFGIDEVLFIPSFSPPHKQGRDISSPFHRYAMVVLATMQYTIFRTSTLELDAMEKRYTVETLEQMGRLYPGAELFFVLGTDMFQELETWKNFRRLFDLANLVVVNRPGFPFREDLAPCQIVQEGATIPAPPNRGVFYLPFVEQPISSTEIREQHRKGGNVSQWLPDAVHGYIEKNGLYS